MIPSDGSDNPKKFVLYSKLAFYPMHWEAFKYICTHYNVKGTVLANSPPEIPSVHQQLGSAHVQNDLGIEIRIMPDEATAIKVEWLRRELLCISPDALWVQEEPTDYYLLQILKLYFFRRQPRIVTAVCENIFTSGSWRHRIIRRVLWRRLNALLGVATPSIQAIRSVGMPVTILAKTLVAGALAPPSIIPDFTLPFVRSGGEFIVGFAGRICEEKGWKVLMKALQNLPPSYKCILAGDGPQIEELNILISELGLQDRVFYVGLLPKEKLWSFYRALDCLVVPSLTTSVWKEQFGGVLADAMSIGLPLIASDSGAIPEVVGEAGIIIPENNPEVLADTLLRLRQDALLRIRLSNIGQKRFKEEFAIEAYANKIATTLQLTR